ncbi:MAG: isoprenylcysteine carboxylmethyltransferase family protein [Pseudonocardiaceae bacterium]|jgi:protein-S-isoprenylcysteine O-methyltransferase Ste14|nr:isoprenylcysteine carboxylmethyltransferase family protein [Pseudonocardiaceae bacterium]
MPAAGLWHWLPALTVTVCWGLFALVWLAGALYNSRRAPAVRERSKAISPWFIGPVAVVVLGRLVPTQFWRSITVDIGWLGVLGIVVLVVSTAFTLWARAALGTMWTASAVVKDDHALRTDGPYAITRHPIYTGLLGMLAGTAAIEGLGRWVAYFVLAVLLVGLKIRTEERLLDRTLGGAYAQYRHQVPQLVPGLRPIRR